MDKLNLAAYGGHPYTSDDLEFLQSSMFKGFEGISSMLKGYATNNVITLNGCVVTEVGTQYVYTAGFVVIAGEIYYVPVQNAWQNKVTGGVFAYDIVETNSAPGNVVYQIGSPQNTWKVRTARIIHTTSAVYPIDTTTNITYVLQQLVLGGSGLTIYAKKTIDTWHVVGSGGGNPAYGSGWAVAPGTRPTQYMKDDVGGVSIRIAATASGAVGAPVFNLPVGYRPVTTVTSVAFKYTAAAVPVPYFVVINSGGDVYINDPVNPGPPNADYLSEIYFKI